MEQSRRDVLSSGFGGAQVEELVVPGDVTNADARHVTQAQRGRPLVHLPVEG